MLGFKKKIHTRTFSRDEYKYGNEPIKCIKFSQNVYFVSVYKLFVGFLYISLHKHKHTFLFYYVTLMFYVIHNWCFLLTKVTTITLK